MIDISVQNIKKAFELDRPVLDGMTFEINAGERVGLLGKNGAGKTTLLKIITGELTEDEGKVVVPDFKKVGLISQIPVYPKEYTVEQVLRTAFERIFKLKAEIEALESEMSESSTEKQLARYDELVFEFERSGGYVIETELNRVTNGLMIPHTQRRQLFSTLSGGEKTRVNLARLLLESTDILLLDEPTNHLDLSATVWLEGFLAKFDGTVLIISHDRYFLDRVIGRVVEIVNGKAEFYSGNYSFYVEERQRRFEEQLIKYERELAESKRLHAAADRLKTWGIGHDNPKLIRQSFAIRKRADRALKTDKPDKDKKLHTNFTESRFRGDETLLIRNLTKTYGEKKLFDIPELLITGRERIAIIGDNGTGKTTLVKILIGEETADTGMARLGPSVKFAYLPQVISFDDPARSILDTLMHEKDISSQMARNRLGKYLFSGEDVFKAVGDLSGGEKSRVRLCILMYGEINLLILDEPTNHLDLQSREWIENALEDYEEALIFISHDRYLINKFATRIWEVKDGVIHDYNCTYEQYLQQKEKTNFEGKKRHKNIQDKSAQRQAQRSKNVEKKLKKPADIEKEINRLEREINAIEKEIFELRQQKSENSSDYKILMELDESEKELQTALDELIANWEHTLSLRKAT